MNKGFTLLELLVVLIMLGVILQFVTPYARIKPGQDLSNATNRLRTLLELAREEAALTSRVWRLTIVPGDNRLHFEQRVAGRFVPLTGEPFADFNAAAGITMKGLRINAQPSPAGGHVYLFPTGEQDAFRLTLQLDGRQQSLRAGPLGKAQVESP